MCGRYALTTPADVLAELFEVALQQRPKTAGARFNVAPTQSIWVARLGRDGQRRLDQLRWGLVPYWAKDPSIGGRMINARSETVADKPVFRDAYRRRRCLVPADGFFEWEATETGKQPYFIHHHDHQTLVFAGLWERWREEHGDAWLETFTILTTRANETLESLHDRMPVIVPADRFEQWLDVDADTSDLLTPASNDLLAIYPVSRRVNSATFDDPLVLEEVDLDEPPDGQGLLF